MKITILGCGYIGFALSQELSKKNEDLEKIIAIGNVDIRKGDRRAKGDRAYYDNKKQIIIVTGDPTATAWEGDNIIRGRKMTFVLEEDIFKVEGRVNLVLNPKNPPPKKKR